MRQHLGTRDGRPTPTDAHTRDKESLDRHSAPTVRRGAVPRRAARAVRGDVTSGRRRGRARTQAGVARSATFPREGQFESVVLRSRHRDNSQRAGVARTWGWSHVWLASGGASAGLVWPSIGLRWALHTLACSSFLWHSEVWAEIILRQSAMGHVWALHKANVGLLCASLGANMGLLRDSYVAAWGEHGASTKRVWGKYGENMAYGARTGRIWGGKMGVVWGCGRGWG